jgi:hypothetical protein
MILTRKTLMTLSNAYGYGKIGWMKQRKMSNFCLPQGDRKNADTRIVEYAAAARPNFV